MKSLDQIFTEQQVVDVTQKILSNVQKEIMENLAIAFYNENEIFLHEHYQNTKDKIFKSLISEICDEFIRDPNSYKFKKLRDKIFEENKEELSKVLTNEVITKNIRNAILYETHDAQLFNFNWKDGLVKFILKNWDHFKEDERVNQVLLRQIDNLKGQIVALYAELEDQRHQIHTLKNKSSAKV